MWWLNVRSPELIMVGLWTSMGTGDWTVATSPRTDEVKTQFSHVRVVFLPPTGRRPSSPGFPRVTSFESLGLLVLKLFTTIDCVKVCPF